MCESNTAVLCESNIKTQPKPLAARQGGERHGICELTFRELRSFSITGKPKMFNFIFERRHPAWFINRLG
jgi:hypothetical protein